MSDRFGELAEEIYEGVVGGDLNIYDKEIIKSALRKLANEIREERDKLWCDAITATQDGTKGNMTCDIAELLAHFNRSRKVPDEA